MNEIMPEIPRIYTAIAEWGACIIYINILNRRFHSWKMVFIAFFALGLQIALLIFTGDLPITFWIPSMITAIIFMFLFIYFSCNINVKDAIYYCVRAFVLAELVASLESQIYWFFWPENNASQFVKISEVVGIYLIIGVAIWILEKRHMPKAWRDSVNWYELWSTLFIGFAIFSISNLSFVSGDTPFSSKYPRDIQNIRTLVDLGGYAMLYAHHVQCCQVRDKRELLATQNILQNQYVQYKQSRESIDMINRKYHDLKHQIAALREERDSEKRNAWLDTMESDIVAYEAQNKTGNNVLDTILTGKSLYCQKHGITLTCVANGALLNFMDVMDICTIFGNSLDNAIECEQKINDKNKRLIHVTVSKKKSFLLLRFENYYEGQLQFHEDLPLTTKKNIDYHGYGLINIKHAVNIYEGAMAISTENNWFELKILIPLK